MMPDYEFHPIANAFPLMGESELAGLIEHIKAEGLQQEIVLYQGKILDGRNRYRACKAGGVPIRTRNFAARDEAHAIAFAIGANLKRKQYTQDQLSMAAQALANMKHGGWRGNQYTDPGGESGKTENSVLPKSEAKTPVISMQAAADQLGVKRNAVERARKVANKAPAAVDAVKQGKITIRAVENLIEEKEGEPVTQTDIDTLVSKKRTEHANTGVQPKIEKLLSDGKWHLLEEIAEYSGVEPNRRGRDRRPSSDSSLGKALKRIRTGDRLALTEEKYIVKRGQMATWRYRVLFKSVKAGGISLAELTEKLRPIIEVLKRQGNAHAASFNPALIQQQAYALQKFLEDWTSRLTATEAHAAKPSPNSAHERLPHNEQVQETQG
jgi:hypothetical protein